MVKDLFNLSRSASAHQWDDVRETFDTLPRLDTGEGHLDTIFLCACNDRKIDILNAMYDKGYQTSAETGPEILTRAAKHSPADDSDAEVIRFLIQTAKVETAECLDTVVSAGNVNGLRKMQEAGADILNNGRSFRMAIFCGQLKTMEYLYTQGAELYTAETLLALKKFNGALSHSCYQRLVQQDCEQTPAPDPQSSLQTIAKAGAFSTVIQDIIQGKRATFQPDDILKKDEEGVSVLGVLTARQELSVLFNTKVWYNRQQEALKVYQHLEDFKALHLFDISHAVTEMQQHALRHMPRRTVKITK
jgi:hypothetical protein